MINHETANATTGLRQLFYLPGKGVTDFDVKSYISECFNCRQMQDWKNGVKSEVMTWRGSTKGVLDSRVN